MLCDGDRGIEKGLNPHSMAPRWHLRKSFVLFFILAGLSQAVTAPFDLSGPQFEVKVTRGNKTLPISEVPTLEAGDRIWVHPALPAEQSVHYLLIAVFLRGATNPPPESWFVKVETWSKQVREEGIVLTVPPGAQQVLLFLAPETWGDFATLRSAVRGRPGAFVRAAQDLDQASLDRSRLDAYLTAVREASEVNPQELQERSILLARSLNIRVDQQCFDKPSEQQAPCLTQNADQLVLDDSGSASMMTTLSSGASADLIGQLSVTRAAGSGVYSAYVGAVVDLAHMLGTLHTAEYQYIPALALPKREELNLKLNNPPSFRKPMSVLVIGLPIVAVAPLPALRHDFRLQVKNQLSAGIDLPAIADPARGGFVVDTRQLHAAAALDSQSTGILHGYWGFQPFDGPSFHVSSAHARKWTVPAAEQSTLIVGRNDVLHLQSDDASCVADVTLKDQQGAESQTKWKMSKPGVVEVQVPLESQTAGAVTISVKQYGVAEPDEIHLRTYSEAGRLDNFAINSGDRQAVLRGTRLDEIAGAELKGLRFSPADLSSANGKDELRLAGPEEALNAFHPGDKLTAQIFWKDGRSRDLAATFDPPRPKVNLVTKNIDPGPTALAIRLGSSEELPQDGKLSFVVKSETPEVFQHTEKIEIGTEDESFDVLLSLEDGLTLEDPRNVLVQLDPLKSFGRSCFGALRFRPVQSDGRKGDWQPLAILVRVPFLTEIHCPRSSDAQCTLSGSNLFLIDSVASDPKFTNSVYVPVGFMDSTLSVPRPAGELLYIKLRDDPLIVSTATLEGIPGGAKSSSNSHRKPGTTVN